MSIDMSTLVVSVETLGSDASETIAMGLSDPLG